MRNPCTLSAKIYCVYLVCIINKYKQILQYYSYIHYCAVTLSLYQQGVGVATVVLASIFISKNGEYGSLLASGTFTLPICILIAGLCILLLGFFGCCGALKENACMLHTVSVAIYSCRLPFYQFAI